MRRTLLAIAAWLVIALAPSPALAWGFDAHRFITRRAIDLLPPELKPFFMDKRDEILVRVVDPDLWRNVGWPEDPNHFLDFGVVLPGQNPENPAARRSYVARFITREVNKLINLPALKDHRDTARTIACEFLAAGSTVEFDEHVEAATATSERYERAARSRAAEWMRSVRDARHPDRVVR